MDPELQGKLDEINGKIDAVLEEQKATNAKLDEVLGVADEEAPADAADAEAKAKPLLKKAEDLKKRHATLCASRDRLMETAKAQQEQTSIRVAAARESRIVGGNRITPAATSTPPAKLHTDDQGRTVGFFEPTDEQVTVRVGQTKDAVRRQSYHQQKRQNLQALKASGYKPWGEFKNAADFIRAGFEGHQHSSFRERANKHFAAVSGMSEGIGSDGGYTVMPEFAGGIIDRVFMNDLWGRTDNYPVTGNNITFLANAETSRATGSRHGGLQGYWLNEGGTITASKPTLREVTLKLAKLGVVVYLTQELIDDGGFALQEYVSRKATEEFEFMIGDALINGTGVGQPLGILNCPSLVSVAKETLQTAATLQTENITKMYARFFAPNRGSMVWLHNQDIEPQLFTMVLGIGAGGVVTYMPPGGLASTPNATLMGREMLPTEFNATLGTQGDLIAADLGQMLSISKGGLMQAVSMHVQFLTDQLALRFVIRLNAGPWENAPLTPYKGSNTQSSFVTLDTRA